MRLRLIIFALFLSPMVGSCISEIRIPATVNSVSRLTIDCGREQKYSTVMVDAHPIAVLCRSPKDLEILERLDMEVFSPDNNGRYGRYRSVRKDVFIAVGVNFHGGCMVDFVPRGTKWPEMRWLGGFHSICHGEVFDMAGRQIKPGKFSPTKVPKFVGNLFVPKYRYISENEIEFL